MTLAPMKKKRMQKGKERNDAKKKGKIICDVTQISSYKTLNRRTDTLANELFGSLHNK